MDSPGGAPPCGFWLPRLALAPALPPPPPLLLLHVYACALCGSIFGSNGMVNMQQIFGDGLNKRLGLNCSDLDCVSVRGPPPL